PSVGPATTVGATVPPMAAGPEPKRSSAVFVVVLVILLLVLAGLIFLLARTVGIGDDGGADQVAVPDVIGRTQPEALTILEGEGFTVKTETGENDQAEENTVFDQNPDPGAKVDEGSEVVITVASSAAPIEVPNLIGQMDVDADSQLRAIELFAEFEREDDPEVPAGTVIEQDPAAGETLPPGSAVRLTVSNGPGTEEVPDVVGMTANEAANVLGRAGFSVTEQTEESDREPNTVIRTEPPAGSQHDRSQPVVVVVSSGQTVATVPDVTGMTQADAETRLSGEGFSNVSADTTSSCDADDEGTVIEQSPAAGSEADPSEQVTITVCQPADGETTTTTSTSTTVPDEDDG
ncbi:MAG TPA: PASTA domain-containing protein, partial [Acidimicrobiales bacterium]|nr:PASTA domain-containing protein [Acidimicrobiales bacterium]